MYFPKKVSIIPVAWPTVTGTSHMYENTGGDIS